MTESVPQWKQDLLKEAEEKDNDNKFLLKLLNDKQEPLNRQAAAFAVPVVWWGVTSLVTLVGVAGSYILGKKILNDNNAFNDGSRTYNQREVEKILKDPNFWKEKSSNIEKEISSSSSTGDTSSAATSSAATTLPPQTTSPITTGDPLDPTTTTTTPDATIVSSPTNPQIVSDEQLRAAVPYIIGFDQIESPVRREKIQFIIDNYADHPIIAAAINTSLDSLPATNQDAILSEVDDSLEFLNTANQETVTTDTPTVTGEDVNVETGAGTANPGETETDTGVIGDVIGDTSTQVDAQTRAESLAAQGVVTTDATQESVGNTVSVGGGRSQFPDSTVTGISITQADPCRDNTLDEVSSQIENLFDMINGPGSAILNLPQAIKDASGMIGRSMNKFVNKMTTALSQKLETMISNGFQELASGIMAQVSRSFPMTAAIAKITGIQDALLSPIKGLFDGIFCASSRISLAIPNIAADLLSGAINSNLLNVPICAVEQMVGGIVTKIASMADSIIGPLLGPVSKVLGIAMNVKDFMLDGIDILKKVSGFFSCGEQKDCPTSTVYKNTVGDQKDKSESSNKKSWDNIFRGAANATANIATGTLAVVGDVAEAGSEILEPLNNPGVLNTISGASLVGGASSVTTAFEESYGKWSIFGQKLSDVEETAVDCNTGNIFECGLPKVEFFGGEGIGGVGKVILGNVKKKFNFDDIYGDVKRTASIVGIEMADGGSGYTAPPIVTLTDNCDRGYGAYAKANIDQNPYSPTYGEILSVSMITVGENYPAEEEEVPLYIGGVVIDDPGEGYEEGDTLENFDLTIVDGRIESVDIVNRVAYSGLPELNISTDLGFGAVLRPLMSKTRPQGDVLQVIDCVGKV
tara:strand:+ start:6174 stop:8771 length:2598 start_codon:yes stop_codon:yes gene_type:complete